MRPCFLIGGRGTGKTTTLQSLKYDATLRRLERLGHDFSDQSYFGVLIRMNKNRVRAFQGRHFPELEWHRLFAHYFNLLVGLELVGLTRWLGHHSEATLKSADLNLIGLDFGFEKTSTLDDLEDSLKLGISRLQLHVNNAASQNFVAISVAESPLRTFVEILSSSGLLNNQIVFCCIDEYENLLDYQQSVINTYIKHAMPPLTYKIGVRKNGLRTNRTLDGNDLLNNPDDFAEIEIAEEGFEYFAKAVAELRLAYARHNGVLVPEKLNAFLAELSLEQEALLLGAKEVADEVIDELRASNNHELVNFFLTKPKSQISFLRYWEATGQAAKSGSLVELARDWHAAPEPWLTRFGNYAFSSLFWLSVGRKGARIRKYYCGERTLITLAGGNIRYFLDLLDTSIGYEEFKSESELILSPKSQTSAARDVGKRRLDQLEGLADRGPQLKRLVLAVGKIFFERTRSPARSAPEQNSFVLTGETTDVNRLRDLISEGVAHLAFEVEVRTKATNSLEMKDDEYRLHRIFSAFFEISYRKKRRTTLDAGKLLSVLEGNPAKAISSLIGTEQSESASLPEQLAFFLGFYDSAK